MADKNGLNDKNKSTSDQGRSATNDKAGDAKGGVQTDTSSNESTQSSLSLSDIGERKDFDPEARVEDRGENMSGDLADDADVRAKIVENKDGRRIAEAPTADAPQRTVSAQEAMDATAMGRPIPGAELRPGDRPDLQVTTKEDVMRLHAHLGDDISNGSVTKTGGEAISEEELRKYREPQKVVVTTGPAADNAEKVAAVRQGQTGTQTATEATRSSVVKKD